MPALPAGLALNTSSGTISGTPTAETAARLYFVTAQLVADSTAETFSHVEILLSVTAIPPTSLAPNETSLSLNLTLNAPMPNVTFAADGDPVIGAVRVGDGVRGWGQGLGPGLGLRLGLGLECWS